MGCCWTTRRPGWTGLSTSSTRTRATSSPRTWKKYDVIGFDPRGVGRSDPRSPATPIRSKRTSCLYGTYASPYGTQGWIDELTARREGLGGRLPQEHRAAARPHRCREQSRATWTSSGRCSATRRCTTSATRTAPTSARCTPSCSREGRAHGARRRRSTRWSGDLDSLATQMAGFDSALKAYMADCQCKTAMPVHRLGADDGCSRCARCSTASTRGTWSVSDGRAARLGDRRHRDRRTPSTPTDCWPDLTQMFNDLAKSDADSTFQNADGYNGRSADGTYTTTRPTSTRPSPAPRATSAPTA